MPATTDNRHGDRIMGLRWIKRSLASFALVLLCAGFALAEVKFYIDLDPASGSVNDEFTMSVVLEGASESSAPYLVGGDDFKLTLIGPERSISMINGVVDQKISYAYRLIPKKSGELQTPSAEVEVDGKKYIAAAKTVSVSGAPSPKSPAAQSKDAFISQRVDKKEVFVGEQIINTIDLYNSIQLYEPQFVDMLFDGFWNEALGEDRRSTRMMEGRQYEVYSIAKALFPLKSGTLTLPVRTLKAKIRERTQRDSRNPFGPDFDPFNNDVFDQFLNRGRVRDITIDSNELEIAVKPLPAAPSNFPTWNLISPIVGKTWIKVSYPADPIKTGDSKTIEVELSSYGNLNPIKDIPIKVGNEFKVYQESPQSKNSVENGKLLSRRVKRISLVALAPGKFEIPGIELGYFDPETQQYQIAKSDPINFEVTGPALTVATSQLSAPIAADTNQVAPISPKDTPAIQPTLTTQPALKWREETMLERLSSQISLGLAVLILGLIALTIWAIKLLFGHSRILTIERQAAQQIDGAADISQLSATFKNSLNKKLGIPVGGSTEQIKAKIREKVTDKDLSSALLTTLDELEILLYGGQTNGSASISEIRERVKNLSREL